jgi:lycopene cyclase domain-containing protein
MNYLYLLINLATISVPLLASYHPKIQFYKNHRDFFTAITISGLFFIGWDVVFAEKEVWGFNDSYLVGFHHLGLPLEEWLFFICIPYASLFLHSSLLLLKSKFLKLSSSVANGLTLVLFLISIGIAIFFHEKLYSFVNALVFALTLVVGHIRFRESLKSFYSSFSVILIPFLIVNGVLTGTLLEAPIVWYNPQEIIGIRFGTIPIEDFMYAFSMLFIPWMIYLRARR